MRFNNLQLIRYGHFTDYTLNFPDGKTSTPDLHIVCGRNEAGKSTISNAMMDFLYGIPTRSNYAFLHSTASLEIAADVSLPSADASLRRLKTQLRNADDEILDSNFLDTHNLSRQDYKSRFWFDDVTLHEGGESILNNKGDLGAALFAATTGLNTLSNQLNDLMLPTDAFFKPGKRTKIQVRELRDSLKDVQKEIKALDTNRTTWNKLTKLHKSQSESIQQIKTELQNKRASKQKLEALKNALKQYHLWKSNQRILESNATLLEVPKHWIEDFQALRQEHHGLDKTLQLVNTEIQALNALITTTPVNDTWRSNKVILEELSQAKELFRQEQQQTQQIQDKLEKSTQSLKAIQIDLSAFPLDKVTQLNLIPTKNIERIDSSIEKWKTTNTLKKHLLHDKEALLSRQDEVKDSNQKTNTIDDNYQNHLDRLQLALDAGGFEELVESGKQQRQRLSELEQETNEIHHALTSIGIDATDDLHKLNAISTETIREVIESRRNAKVRIDAERSKAQQLQATISKLDKQLAQLGHTHTDENRSYKEANAALRKSWSNLQTLLANQADNKIIDSQIERVEKDLAIMEDSVQQHFDTAENVGKINSALQTQQDTSSELIAVMNHISAEEQQLESLINQQNSLIEHLPHVSFDDSNTLLMWRESLEQWRNLDRKRLSQQSKVDDLNSECEQQKAHLLNLVTALNTQGLGNENPNNISLTESLVLAKNALKAGQEIWQKEQLLARKGLEYEQENARLSFKLKESTSQLELHEEEIQSEIAGTWIENCPTTSVVANWPLIKRHASQCLEVFALESSLNAAQQTVSRVTSQITSLNQTLSLNSTGDATNDLNHLVELHQTQLKQDTELRQHTDRLAEQKSKLNLVTVEIKNIEETIRPMHDGLSTSTLDELQTALNQAKAIHQTRQEQNQLELGMCEQLAVDTFLQARVDLDKAMQALEANAKDQPEQNETTSTGTDESDVPQRTQIIRAQMDHRINELAIEEATYEQSLMTAHNSLHDTESQLENMGLDERVAELRQKETDLIHEIEEGVIHTMKLRLGLRAIERGLQHFRDQNRSGMLAEAKRSFTALTQGNYTDLVTRANDKGVEHLFAIRNNGQSVSAEQLSVGTRYQLYLALRIAAYHEYRQHRTPLPFIADDIFETFDEPRTKSALTELSNMATHGQVIYFTHHLHVAEIAREVVPNVNTIALP